MVGGIKKKRYTYILSVQCVVFSIFCQNTLLHTFSTEFYQIKKKATSEKWKKEKNEMRMNGFEGHETETKE